VDEKKTKTDLEDEFWNSQLNTTLTEKQENETDLVRSNVPLVVNEEDAEKWKLSLISINFSYQCNGNPDKKFSLKAYEKGNAYINGTYIHKDLSLFGSMSAFSFKRL